MKLAYRLKHGKERLARTCNHLTFLIRCRENGLIPKGLRIKIPVNSISLKNGRKLARRTSEALLRQLIKETRYKKVRTEQDIKSLEVQICRIVTNEQMAQILEWCSKATNKVHETIETKQIKKFNELRAHKFGPKLEVDKVVKNLSKRQLTVDEKEVLALGFNYSITPRTVPVSDVIAATEASAQQLPTELADHAA